MGGQNKNTVYLTIGEPFVTRNLFFTAWWPELVKGLADKYQLVVFVRSKDLEKMSARFKLPGVEFVAVEPKFKNSFLANNLLSLARSCLATRTNKWSKMRSYLRQDSGWLSTKFKVVFAAIFGHCRLMKKLLRYLILKQVSSSTQALFPVQPSNVFIATSITCFEFDVPLLAAAKQAGYLTLGLPRSWDNFTSHGLTRVWPDYLFVQDEYLAKMAVQHQLWAKPEKLAIFGTPSYDQAYDNDIFSRSELLSKLGLGTNDKYLIYGAMGTFLFKSEDLLPAIFDAAAQGLSADYKIVYRMHPKFALPPAARQNLSRVIFDKTAADEVTADMDLTEMKYLRSLITHSEAVITCASTFALDATVFNKPILLINFDPAPQVYWNSVKRFYDSYDHFERFVELAKPLMAISAEQLPTLFQAVIKQKQTQNREVIMQEFIEPFDGRSGERLAEKMLAVINRS